MIPESPQIWNVPGPWQPDLQNMNDLIIIYDTLLSNHKAIFFSEHTKIIGTLSNTILVHNNKLKKNTVEIVQMVVPWPMQ